MPNIFLIPNCLSPDDFKCIPKYFIKEIKQIDLFVIEKPKTFRRLLVHLGLKEKINTSTILEWPKKGQAIDWWNIINAKKGLEIGIVSDAGCPAVADPGTEIVLWGHKNGYQIRPLVGPNSIIMSLMASGLNGQTFSFNSYLPIEEMACNKKLKDLESSSRKEKRTQIFIETPYRNDKLFRQLILSLSPETNLCVAIDITGEKENIRTKKIKEWAKRPIIIGKQACIFLFLA
tara:strand:+ start:3596 stop:4291 length:696 start_codon:yes stop_codon:yes gene_type:complete